VVVRWCGNVMMWWLGGVRMAWWCGGVVEWWIGLSGCYVGVVVVMVVWWCVRCGGVDVVMVRLVTGGNILLWWRGAWSRARLHFISIQTRLLKLHCGKVDE
jgi:hypothetical protein